MGLTGMIIIAVLAAAKAEGETNMTATGEAMLFRELDEYLAGIESRKSTPSEGRREALAPLVEWLRTHDEGAVIAVCTGNSRRSMLTAMLGNALAVRHGKPGLRFYSGGTHPSAFNERTIRTLRKAGFEVTDLQQEAPRGEDDVANRRYTVTWGPGERASIVEFSKKYDDAANPAEAFVALMVCDEAEEACPVVRGAAVRIAMPFVDPKEADGTDEEEARYDATRDDIAGLLTWAFEQSR